MMMRMMKCIRDNGKEQQQWQVVYSRSVKRYDSDVCSAPTTLLLCWGLVLLLLSQSFPSSSSSLLLYSTLLLCNNLKLHPIQLQVYREIVLSFERSSVYMLLYQVYCILKVELGRSEKPFIAIYHYRHHQQLFYQKRFSSKSYSFCTTEFRTYSYKHRYVQFYMRFYCTFKVLNLGVESTSMQ